MKNKIYNVGIYTRLSQDDERQGESLSIENQKNLLTRYATEEGWNIHFTYVDDGYSGTNFDRPAFQQMLNDIKNGAINLVLIKDLSRLGRNHVQVGHFIEDILPNFKCRLVALNNNVDTGDINNSSNEMMGFLNLFNEFHSRETSKKVRSSKKSCAERGMFIGPYAPYGYKKSDDDRHNLVIDKEIAPIVQRIFKLRSKGSSYRGIAVLLNEEHIVTARDLYYQRKNQVNPHKMSGLWSATTVKQILLNEVYVGNMVQGKCGSLSYKSKKIIHKDIEDWIKVENTHEGLISPELWNQVSALSDKNYLARTPKHTSHKSSFTSMMECETCGSKMRLQVEHQKRKDGSVHIYTGFTCGNYARRGRKVCTPHTINEVVLNDIVIDEIKALAKAVTYNEENVINKIVKARKNDTTEQLVVYKKELQSNADRLVELEKFIDKLYTDRLEHKISEEMFTRLVTTYDTEMKAKIEGSREISEILKSLEEQVCDASQWASNIKKYIELETLEKDVMIELIDKIIIGEPTRIDGKKICNLKIIYRMVGDLSSLESEVSADEDFGQQAV